MSDLLGRLQQSWRNQGIIPGNGAPAVAVRTFERATGLRFPNDFREYVLALNGFAEYDWDRNNIWFVALDGMKTVDGVYPSCDLTDNPARWLVSADYIIQSHVYALHCAGFYSDATHVAICWNCGARRGGMRIIAPSFTVFIERYLAGDENILLA